MTDKANYVNIDWGTMKKDSLFPNLKDTANEGNTAFAAEQKSVQTNSAINKQYKDTIFKAMFLGTSNATPQILEDCKKEFLHFYKTYCNQNSTLSSDEIVACTLADDTVIAKRHNDVAYKTTDNHYIILTEHQSSHNPNMPFREMEYYVMMCNEQMNQLSQKPSSNVPIKQPIPEFYVVEVYIRRDTEKRTPIKELSTEFCTVYEECLFDEFNPFLCVKVRVFHFEVERIFKEYGMNFRDGTEQIDLITAFALFIGSVNNCKNKVLQQYEKQHALLLNRRSAYNKGSEEYKSYTVKIKELNNLVDVEAVKTALNTYYPDNVFTKIIERVGEYNMIQETPDLLMSYDDLRLSYDDLRLSYDDLQNQYGNLHTSYDNLQDHYDNLQEHYGDLQEHYGDLQEHYGDLQEHYGDLQEHYGDLQEHYGDLQEQFKANNNQIRNIVFALIRSMHNNGYSEQEIIDNLRTNYNLETNITNDLVNQYFSEEM